MYLRHHRLTDAIFCGVLLAPVAASTMAGQSGRKIEDQVVLHRQGDSFSLANAVIGARWSVANGKLSGLVVHDQMHGTDIRVDEPFRILLGDEMERFSMLRT